jgi:hypothetical protein
MTLGKWGKREQTESVTGIKGIYIAAGIIIAVLICTGVFSGAADRLMYTEQFETGKVEISLQDMWGQMPCRPDDMILAGSQMNYTPRIENRAAECFVRAKVKISTGDKEPEFDSEAYIYGLSKAWVRKGEYYYYKHALGKGEAAEIFRGIAVPEHWSAEEKCFLTVDIRAEAVQSANFAPDFESPAPWGAVMLQEVGKGVDTCCAVPLESTSEIMFESEGTFQCNTDELFENLENVMPGDRYSKEMSVKNCTGKPLALTLKIHADKSRLNEAVRVKIMYGDAEIFRGTAPEAVSQGEFTIGHVPRGEKGKLEVMLEFPAYLDNDYTEIRDCIMWELSAGTPDESVVSTGDPSELLPYALLCLMAAAVMILVPVYRKRRRK